MKDELAIDEFGEACPMCGATLYVPEKWADLVYLCIWCEKALLLAPIGSFLNEPELANFQRMINKKRKEAKTKPAQMHAEASI